jgi:NTE family protein
LILKKVFGIGKKRKIVYTLSGGAAYGYAHIGVLKYLEEHNICPDAIVGTSMGAVVGGLYACGLNPMEIEAVAQRLRSAELMRLFFPSFPRGGIVDSGGVREFLSHYTGDRRIEELSIDYRTVAVDIHTGEEVIFDHGPLLDAILASMSIPAIFNPYHYRGRDLVDGGVLNNLRGTSRENSATSMWS